MSPIKATTGETKNSPRPNRYRYKRGRSASAESNISSDGRGDKSADSKKGHRKRTKHEETDQPLSVRLERLHLSD